MRKIQQDLKWARGFKAFNDMCDRLSAKKTGSMETQIMYARGLKLFHDFSGITPDDIIQQWAEGAKADYEAALETWDIRLDKFMNWLMREKGLKKSSAVTHHSSIRALIKWNSRRKLTIETPSRGIIQSLTPLTLEEVQDLTEIASPQQKWIILGLKDSGMSREDFAALTFGHVRKGLAAGSRTIQINAVRRKEEIQYVTHIGPNAIKALKLYLRLRENRGEKITDSSGLTLGDYAPHAPITLREITQSMRRLGVKLGLKASPHRLRKTFETYMGLRVKHPIILKYWMGHKLAMTDIEAKYVIPPPIEQQKLYEESYMSIDIDTYASVEEREKAIREITDKIMRGEPLGDMDKESIRRHGIRLGKRRKQVKKDCENGVHCESGLKQIPEVELLKHLQEGWQIIYKLSDGSLIVKQ